MAELWSMFACGRALNTWLVSSQCWFHRRYSHADCTGTNVDGNLTDRRAGGRSFLDPHFIFCWQDGTRDLMCVIFHSNRRAAWPWGEKWKMWWDVLHISTHPGATDGTEDFDLCDCFSNPTDVCKLPSCISRLISHIAAQMHFSEFSSKSVNHPPTAWL